MEDSNPMDAARAAVQERIAKGLSAYRDPIEKSRLNPTSLRAAVNGKCWDCSGGGADSGTREAIRECPVTSCTLYYVRPYQKKAADGGTLSQ